MVDYPLDLNMTNFTTEPMRYATFPFMQVFGEFTFGILFLFIGWALYIGSDGDKVLTAIYFWVTAALFGPILSFYLVSLMLLLGGLVFTGLVINRFLEKT